MSIKKKPKANHLILDFTHVYCDEHVEKHPDLTWIDCSDIEECDMYCSEAAYHEIWRRIAPYGTYGIHFIDSGNYHYISKIMTDHIDLPFSLVLYDHHTDMQKPMSNGLMSCGDWAGLTAIENPHLHQLILVGPEQTDIEQSLHDLSLYESDLTHPNILTFSSEELKSKSALHKLNSIDRTVPFYLSIDKDILSTKYSETNWNQGDMPLGVLEELLQFFLGHDRILGIDICGECPTSLPVPLYLEAEHKNETTNRELYEFITSQLLS